MEPKPDRKPLTNLLQPMSTWNCFPVVDCTECHMLDAPYGVSCNRGQDGYVTHYWCLNCRHSTLEKPVIKGYVSLFDLENTDWDSEL